MTKEHGMWTHSWDYTPGQRSSFTIFLFLRLAFEGNESNLALHKTILTLLGTCSLHTPFQRLLVSDKSKVEGSPFSTSSKSDYGIARNCCRLFHSSSSVDLYQLAQRHRHHRQESPLETPLFWYKDPEANFHGRFESVTHFPPSIAHLFLSPLCPLKCSSRRRSHCLLWHQEWSRLERI